MNGPIIELVIGVATLVLSMTGSAFIAGTRWSRIESDIHSMSDRLAKIEGMFTLQLKQGPP